MNWRVFWFRAVMTTLAAYGLAHAATKVFLVPLPPDVDELLRLAALVLFVWLLRLTWDRREPPDDTPLDT